VLGKMHELKQAAYADRLALEAAATEAENLDVGSDADYGDYDYEWAPEPELDCDDESFDLVTTLAKARTLRRR
jgi:hypothetical protein